MFEFLTYFVIWLGFCVLAWAAIAGTRTDGPRFGREEGDRGR